MVVRRSKAVPEIQRHTYQDPEILKRWQEFHGKAIEKIAFQWLADHDIEPVQTIAPRFPSPLDQEAEALAAEEEEASEETFEDAGEADLDRDGDEDLDEFDEADEADYIESVDFLTEDEETELTDFVEAFPAADFNLAKLHGLLSAFAVGPVTMSPADLLTALMQCAGEKSVNDTAQSARILDLLSRFYDGIVESIEDESFAPRLQQRGVMLTDPASGITSWCNGFMLGVDHHKSLWQRWFSDIRRTKAISLIAGMADPETLRKAEKTIGEETIGATWSTLSMLVPLIRDFWAFESALDEYLGPQPDNPELKVGRNDPCPCGSGKKFKHCHGRFESF